jgi:tetraacyldisaccharide 4'-kinase
VISRVYARLLEARARRYASGKAISHRLEHPVISVGNITMGGTGKTPFVAHLARRLKFEGKHPAILSRGYGRTSRGVVLVSEGNGPLVTPDVGGDEPVALAMRLPGVIVAVGERRVEAARAAQRSGADVLLLDDGFQHLSLDRDANLLLLDARDPFGGGRFPPRGRLREPLSALARADAFVFTRAEPGTPTAEVAATLRHWNAPAPIFTARLRPAGLFDESGSPVEVAALGQRRVLAVCAVANPASFAATLSEVGLTPEQIVSYRDHHRYSARDFGRIERIARAAGASWIVTTEKDAVKLGSGLTLPTVTLRLAVEVGEPGFFPFLASRISGTPRTAARAGR